MFIISFILKWETLPCIKNLKNITINSTQRMCSNTYMGKPEKWLLVVRSFLNQTGLQKTKFVTVIWIQKHKDCKSWCLTCILSCRLAFTSRIFVKLRILVSVSCMWKPSSALARTYMACSTVSTRSSSLTLTRERNLHCWTLLLTMNLIHNIKVTGWKRMIAAKLGYHFMYISYKIY